MATQTGHTESQRRQIGKLVHLVVEPASGLTLAEEDLNRLYSRMAASECYDDETLDRAGMESEMDQFERHVEETLQTFRDNRAKLTSTLEKKGIW